MDAQKELQLKVQDIHEKMNMTLSMLHALCDVVLQTEEQKALFVKQQEKYMIDLVKEFIYDVKQTV